MGEAGLVYDLLVRPRELPAALAVARALPDLRLVIDHCAKPRVRDGEDPEWAERMAPFAGLTSVHCKVSGLVTEADRARWTPADLEPFVSRVLDWFGTDRVLFGSDWPVCLLAASYGRVLDALGGLPPAALGENAARVYRLGQGVGGEDRRARP